MEENKQNPDFRKKEKKKKKKNDVVEFEFCKICKLNHNQGRGHNYIPNHKNSLSSFLSRFQKKLSEVRFFLKNPTVLRPEHASRNRLWCVFCDCDVEELGSVFACCNAINHLASSEHLKNLKHFLWKYGGGTDRVDSFRLSEAELTKWEKRCRLLKNSDSLSYEGSNGTFLGHSNDIHKVHNSNNIDNLGNSASQSFKSCISNGFVPLQCFTNERHQEHHGEVTGAANVETLQRGATLKDCEENQQSIFVRNERSSGCCSSSVTEVGRLGNGKIGEQEPKDNVHFGAPPPWLEENELDIHSNARLHVNSSSLQKPSKAQKLNPKRVGAAWAEKRKMELEREKRGEIVSKDYDADWLPDFGRVWQSGSRKESRKEFQTEKQKMLNDDNVSEVPIVIQPYISKRLRRNEDEGDGVVGSHFE